VVNATTITATTGAHAAGAVNVVVTNPDTQAGTLTNGFTYFAPPAVTSVTPTSGPTAGGTGITITGSDFVAGATAALGGVAATGVTVVNATTITAITGAHAAGAVNVVVTNPDTQAGTLTNGFTYLAPPAVTGITPTSGSTAGGTGVTITGSNFVTGATVALGGVAATGVTVANATTITAITGAHAAGAVNVVVTSPDGQSGTLTSGFTYGALSPPTVTSITPNSGSTAGGTGVTITGTNFFAGATVALGGVAATGVAVVNATTITATTGAHAAGTVNVVVTNPDLQAGTLTKGFTYRTPPVVTSVTPNSGSTAGGTGITITGSNFVAGATVALGGVAATGVTVVNATTITATTGAHAAGAVNVVVTIPGGLSGTLASGFSYGSAPPPPTVTGIAPNSGSTAGGTGVTITGSNFVAGATVALGGVAATGVTVVNATTITATTGAHAAGSVDVVVTNPDSQSGTLASGFIYGELLTPPTVTSVTPNSGPTPGGTAVTISGTNFVAGATVALGGVAATGVTVVNATTITGTTGAHAAGAVNVVVTNPDTQAGTLTNGFTYLAPPAVTSITPTSGSTGGGTSVTITGSNFVAGATVALGGVAATGVTVVNATTITATTGAHAAGAVNVVVTNPNGQSGTLTNGFTYGSLSPPPTVTSVTPNSGSTAGGTGVTITGSNFVAGATVTLGGVAATGVTVVNATTITATTGAHAAGAVTVVVTNPNLQSGSLTKGFLYVTPPAVSSITPD